MLFGIRVLTEGSFRKSVSLNNLSQYEQLPHELAAADQEQNVVDHHVLATGYVSDDVAARSRERKRGVPWTEEEHKLFLLGLQKVGKGDWRGISRNFVKTRTPTQVASHAQKSSLFDITTDTFMETKKSSTIIHQEEMNKLVTQATGNLQVQEAASSKIIRQNRKTHRLPYLFALSTSPPTTSSSSTTSDVSRQFSRHSAFKSTSSSSCFSSGDNNNGNIISVA
ncbi:hypothetical protein MKW92_023927 [Papaver armeniacum]|nr:hypothetical protein MKW92_023927 [Papaver armeniacum]